jgi:hypothetical protein
MRCLLIAAWLLSIAAAAPPAPLTIVNVALHQFEDGPTVPSSFAFLPGDTVFVSFQVAGFQAEGDDKLVKLDYFMAAYDSAGIPIVEPKAGKLKAELAPEDKEWKPKVRWEFVVPPLAESGTYRITMSVKDVANIQEAGKAVTFNVQGHQVEKSDTLVVRNFRFLRSEDDAPPLNPAAYRPGDTVWARFDITGFKVGEKNRPQVEYDITVQAPSGKAMFTQQNAAVEQEPSFYPKRYVPGTLSLTLQPTIKPGGYTIVLAVRDGVGKQVAESRHLFVIE